MTFKSILLRKWNALHDIFGRGVLPFADLSPRTFPFEIPEAPSNFAGLPLPGRELKHKTGAFSLKKGGRVSSGVGGAHLSFGRVTFGNPHRGRRTIRIGITRGRKTSTRMTRREEIRRSGQASLSRPDRVISDIAKAWHTAMSRIRKPKPESSAG